MAARNFEDLLQVCTLNDPHTSSCANFVQCSIPVFDGLFPDAHNCIIIDLLFTLSHWHGLAKLRMHSDLTLDILDQQTTDLGEQFRRFKDKVCPSYHTQELDREVGVRSRRQTKKTVKGSGINNGQASQGSNTKGKEKVRPEQSENVPGPKQSRRNKLFNIQTYKFHVLGDYVACIRRFGTTDSYSTEPVSCSP